MIKSWGCVTKLELAIEDLYSVFASYTAPQDPSFGLWGYHNYSPEAISQLMDIPLRGITNDAIQGYTCEAFLYWGDLTDFKYFLPRVLEMLVKFEDKWLDDQMIFGRLNYEAPLSSWALQEQTVILTFAQAWLEDKFVTEYKSGAEDYYWWEDQICALSCAYDDIIPFLQFWLESNDMNANFNFSDFIVGFLENQTKEMQCAYWGNDPETPYRTVETWLLTSPTLTILRQRQIEYAQNPHSTIISKAIQLIEHEQAKLRYTPTTQPI